MKVCIIGATGFTGGFVVRELVRRNLKVRCVVRTSSETSALPRAGIELVSGDLDDMATVHSALSGCDCLVFCASLGFGHGPAVVKTVQRANVSRAIFFSSTSIFTSLNAASKTVRLGAEEAIRESSLSYTILRPTMIYGTRRDRNISRLIGYIGRRRILFIPGSGESLLQPVHVQDLASAAVDCIGNERTVRREYNLSGKDSVSFNALVRAIEAVLSREILKVHLPARPIIALLSLLESLSIVAPIKAEQVERLQEDKVFDYGAADLDFGYSPRALKKGLMEEAKELGLI